MAEGLLGLPTHTVGLGVPGASWESAMNSSLKLGMRPGAVTKLGMRPGAIAKLGMRPGAVAKSGMRPGILAA